MNILEIKIKQATGEKEERRSIIESNEEKMKKF
jgi:hypothetical protein